MMASDEFEERKDSELKDETDVPDDRASRIESIFSATGDEVTEVTAGVWVTDGLGDSIDVGLVEELEGGTLISWGEIAGASEGVPKYWHLYYIY